MKREQEEADEAKRRREEMETPANLRQSIVTPGYVLGRGGLLTQAHRDALPSSWSYIMPLFHSDGYDMCYRQPTAVAVHSSCAFVL